MGRQQKGKGFKRKRQWHRGRGEAALAERAMSIFDKIELYGENPTGEPIDVRKNKGPGQRRFDHDASV